MSYPCNTLKMWRYTPTKARKVSSALQIIGPAGEQITALCSSLTNLKINFIHMLWSASRQLIVFKSHDKYISSTKTVLTNIKIYFMRTSSTTIICHLVCCEYLNETSRTGSKKCSHVHCSKLENRFSELKNLTVNFQNLR